MPRIAAALRSPTLMGILTARNFYIFVYTHFVTIHTNTCTIGPCESFPCKNGAVCTEDGSSFSCKCSEDYQGKTCSGRQHSLNTTYR